MNSTESTQTATRACLRCGRKLTASTGAYGPKCAAKVRAAALAEVKADFSASQQAKADELIRDGGLVPTNREGVYRAVSSDGTGSYMVAAQVCNCHAGLKGRR